MPLLIRGLSTMLLLLLVLLCNGFADSYVVDRGFEPRSRVSMSYKYERIDEVNKECGFVLASASELKPDDNRVYSIKEELSFLNGDWWQERVEASILPFDDRDVSNTSLDLRSPVNLVSFWVTDVDRGHRRSKKSISVSGVLQMGLTLEGLFVQKPDEGSHYFDIWPGHTQLSIYFEGIYTETKKDRAERVMCLLGNTMLPSRQPDSTDPWEWVKESGYSTQPPLIQDDKILLVLRYPRTFSLTNRAIRGSMRSLSQKTSLKFFNEVHVSSWRSASSNYEFGSENIVSKSCDPYPYKDNGKDGDIDVYKGFDFCDILERFTRQEALIIVPNWKCNGTDDYCSKLGPFMSDKEIRATDGSFKDVKLVIQDVQCQKMTLQENVGFTRVSSVFRAVPPFENQFTAAQRTGLSNMTLPAEGIWKSSSGQLCMVGCLGYVDKESNRCDSRICLYIPLSFSIKQRSIIMGSISSLDESKKSYFPLSFEKLIRPAELQNLFMASRPYYKYSKIDAAGVVLEKNEAFNFGNVIKKSLLKFPKLKDSDSFLVSLSLLSEDLTLHVSAVADPATSRVQRTDIQLEILSLGPVFGRYWSSQNVSAIEKEYSYQTKVEYTEKQLLLNVSAQIRLSGQPYKNFSTLFVEGLYNPPTGKMYLIGCRDVRASWNILYESMDLEAGLDCLVEVIISYPPTTARWLNPTAKLSISSQRNEDDPLYFSSIKLQSFPIMYSKQREDILSRRGVEGILRIVTLSMAVAFISSQLFYTRDNIDTVPYISLVMLGVQAFGYGLQLINGAETFFQSMASESYESPTYDLDTSQWVRVLDITVKLLVLVAFSLVMRLFQKVWKSRIRLLTRTPLEPHRLPSDKPVLLTISIIHIVGYIIVLIIHFVNTSHKPLQTERYIDSTGSFHIMREWETELEEYVGLVQDFFLLPQIIGNFLWEIEGIPLRKLYYIGITVVRLLPHLYDYIASPVSIPYFTDEYEFVNPRLDFYSKFGDIAIPATAVLLAVLVYLQQRLGCQKLIRILSFGQSKLLPWGSKVYERLPSVSFEAELASRVDKEQTEG